MTGGPSAAPAPGPAASPTPTLRTYRYPDTLVHEYVHWAVLLRPAQVTLGSLVLAARSAAESLGALEQAAFTELKQVIGDIEATLRAEFGYDKINYVAIMINDPNPHFHVIPRYSAPRRWQGREFVDAAWPLPPDLGHRLDLDAGELESLRHRLRDAWILT
jgi:diadenosine tetraphosphate (Ap4A) HIT family hydrolase